MSVLSIVRETETGYASRGNRFARRCFLSVPRLGQCSPGNVSCDARVTLFECCFGFFVKRNSGKNRSRSMESRLFRNLKRWIVSREINP